MPGSAVTVPDRRESALDGVTVTEIAGPYGQYAGKLLADHGADVTLVEPPDGARQRHAGPFIGGTAGPERSLTFSYMNTSKYGVTLDLDDPQARARLHTLAAAADVLIDGTGQMGYLSGHSLGYQDLAAANPALVYVSITPFGIDGPYAGYEATDLTLMAMGGLLSLGGYADAGPVRAYGDQALLAAGQFAAVATMLAVLEAEATGVGQLVDVSAQEAVSVAHENAVQYWDLQGVTRGRTGGDQRRAGVGVYPCRDGYVYMQATGLGEFWEPLVSWLEAEGIEGGAGLRDPKWQDMTFAASTAGKSEFRAIFGALALHRDKAQLYEAARAVRLPLCPVNTPADVAASGHLRARGYFVEVEHPPTGSVLVMPGAPFLMSASPGAIRRPAPGLGQHNHDVLERLAPGRTEVTRTPEGAPRA